MDSTRKLRKHYDKFTPVERVNLVLAAQERDDEAEVRALEDYCPLAQLLEHEERILRLMQAASALAVQLLAREVLIVKRLEDLVNVNVNANAPQNVKEAAANPASDDLDSDIADGYIAAANDDKLASLLEQAAAAWHGFSAWCRDVGHDPHQVLRLAPIGSDDRDPAYFIIQQQIELSERWAHDLLRDPDEVETWRQLFAQAFQSMDTA